MSVQTASFAPSTVHPGRLLALLCFAYLLGFLDRIIFSLAVPAIKAQLLLNDQQLGLLSGLAFAVSYALFAPVAGYFADRRSRKQILMYAVAVWSLATAATALADSFWTMFAARAVVGVGEATLIPLAVSLISDTRTGHSRDRAFGMFLAAGAVGNTAALLFGGAIIHFVTRAGGLHLPAIGAVSGWQSLFLAAGAAGVLLVAVIAALMRDPPRAGPSAAAPASDAGSAWAFVRSHPMLIATLYLGFSLVQMATVATPSWLIATLVRSHGWSAGETAVRLGLTAGVTLIVGAVAIGPLIKAVRQRGHANAALLVALLCVVSFAVFLVAGLFATGTAPVLTLVAIAFFFGYTPTVCSYVMMGEVLPSHVRAQLAGINTFSNALICNSLATYLVGLLSDKAFPGPRGLAVSLSVVVVASVVLGSLVILLGLRAYSSRMKEFAEVASAPSSAK
uniref:Major facilitator superfamily MFS_1 n=1 Tax=Caulobacter sp. (strain K31) TaxID=366602 RepID=B0T6M2_CAUSK